MDRRLVALAASLLLLGPAAPMLAVVARAEPPHGAGPVLVRWTQRLGGTGDVDRGPSIELRADGTVTVDYPRYMKRAGTWSMRLDRKELDALVGSIAASGVLSFEAAEARAEVARVETAARAAAARTAGVTAAGVTAPVVVAVHDAATTRLELHLDRLERRAPGARPTRVAVAKTIEWPALAADASRFPEASAIQGLAAAERALAALLERRELVRVGEPR